MSPEENPEFVVTDEKRSLFLAKSDADARFLFSFAGFTEDALTTSPNLLNVNLVLPPVVPLVVLRLTS